MGLGPGVRQVAVLDKWVANLRATNDECDCTEHPFRTNTYLTIKKLTRGNPTMAEKFTELKSGDPESDD